MKPAAFEYHAPASLDEAVGLLAELGEGAKALAGGQSLIPMLALRLAAFEHLVDITRISDLVGIERRQGTLHIGAGTLESSVGSSGEVAAAVPLLARATPLVGHFQIRNRGTLGGSIAHADPAAEYPAVAVALDAVMEVGSVRGRRRIAAADFFDGLWSTTMEPDELLLGVDFPLWGRRSGFGVEELARRHGDFALAGAAVGVELDDDRRVRRCAIGLFGLGSSPLRAAAAEAVALGQPVGEVVAADVGRAATEGLGEVPSDLHGSAEYRRRVGAVVVARAWASASEEAGGA